MNKSIIVAIGSMDIVLPQEKLSLGSKDRDDSATAKTK